MADTKKNAEKTAKEKTPQLLDKSGEIARGLSWPLSAAQKKTVAEFNISQTVCVGSGKVSLQVRRGQFGKYADYCRYMSTRSKEEARQWTERAKDADAHPDKYAPTRKSTAEKVAEAEARAAEEFAAKQNAAAQRVAEKFSITLEEALDMLNG